MHAPPLIIGIVVLALLVLALIKMLADLVRYMQSLSVGQSANTGRGTVEDVAN